VILLIVRYNIIIFISIKIFLKETEVIVDSLQLKTELEKIKSFFENEFENLIINFKKEQDDSEKKHQEELEMLNKKFEDVKNENNSLKKKIEDSEKKHQEEFEYLNKKFEDSEKKHQEEIVNVKKASESNIKKEVDNLKNENSNLIKKFEDNDKKNKGEIDNLKNGNTVQNNKLDNLIKENSDLKIKLENTEREIIISLNNKIENINKENSDLKIKLENTQGVIVNLQNQINTLKTNHENNKTGCNSSTTELQEKLKELENTLSCEMDFGNFNFTDGSDESLYNISRNLISFTANDKWTSLFSNKEIEKVSFSFFFIIY
jgi:chromosome segregation ATPase